MTTEEGIYSYIMICANDWASINYFLLVLGLLRLRYARSPLLRDALFPRAKAPLEQVSCDASYGFLH